MNSLSKPSSSGFSLIELCIVLIIGSLALAAGVRAYTMYQESQKTAEEKDKTAVIKLALAQHLDTHGTYPCPASLSVAPDSMSYGRATNCSNTSVAPGTCQNGICVANDHGRRVRIGTLPARDLDISVDNINDIHNNRYTYAVTERLARTTVDFDNIGAIDIQDSTGTSALKTAGTAHFAIISHGKNGKGSFTRTGIPNTMACIGNTQDRENCDGDAVFVKKEYALGDTPEYYDDAMFFDLHHSNINVSCPPGELLAEIKNGQPVCVDLELRKKCPTGQFLYWVNLDQSKAECRAVPPANAVCPPGQYLRSIKQGAPVCDTTNAVCPAGQYLSAIKQGKPECKPLPTQSPSGSCKLGQAIEGYNNQGQPICTQIKPSPQIQCYGFQGKIPCGYNYGCASTNDGAQCPAGWFQIGMDICMSSKQVVGIMCQKAELNSQ